MAEAHGATTAPGPAADGAPASMLGPSGRPVYRYKRKYRPLDVKSWFEGFLRLIGWILVIVIPVVTGGLFIVYEWMVLNGHDRDWRDLYLDQRLTNNANNVGHKNFLLADACCNEDAVFFPYTCFESDPDDYMENGPYCKPKIVMECTDIRSAACNSTRAVLYSALGMTISGVYQNCLKAGRVRAGSQVVASGRPITLVAYFQGFPTGDTLLIQSPFNINATVVQQFVDDVARKVDPRDVDYVQPNNKLSSSVYVEGMKADMFQTMLRTKKNRGIKAPPPWNAVKELFPWPGNNKRCSNTAVNISYGLTGTVDLLIPQFQLGQPQAAMLTLQVANDTKLLPAWQVQPLDTDDLTGDNQTVKVAYLSNIKVTIGQALPMGACFGWRITRGPLYQGLNYTTYWTGSLALLRDYNITLGPLRQNMTIDVYDLNAPRNFQLPPYGGMFYIFGAIGCGGVWMFSNGLILFVIILVWWNIRSNKGLPPIIYRYMQKYRGW